MAVLFILEGRCLLSQTTVVGFILFVVLLQHSLNNQTFDMNTSYLCAKQTNNLTNKKKIFYFKTLALVTSVFAQWSDQLESIWFSSLEKINVDVSEFT